MNPPLNRRSKTITEGVSRSPNRAMLRAVGFTDADFNKPIVGVASGHSTMNPCNAGLGSLATRADSALKEAGAMPQTFGFPTVTDGIAMGTEGMKYSLVERRSAHHCFVIRGRGRLQCRQDEQGRLRRHRAPRLPELWVLRWHVYRQYHVGGD